MKNKTFGFETFVAFKFNFYIKFGQNYSNAGFQFQVESLVNQKSIEQYIAATDFVQFL